MAGVSAWLSVTCVLATSVLGLAAAAPAQATTTLSQVTTFSSQINDPVRGYCGVAGEVGVDPSSGDVWGPSADDLCVARWSSSGQYLGLEGSGAGSAAGSFRSIVVDPAGQQLLLDSTPHDGGPTFTFDRVPWTGEPDAGIFSSFPLNSGVDATAIARNPKNGDIYVLMPQSGGGSGQDAALYEYPPDGGAPDRTIATWGTGAGQVDNPSGIAVDPANGNVYVTDVDYGSFGSPQNVRVEEWDSSGSYVRQFATGTDYASGIAVDPLTGELYVIGNSSGNPSVSVFSSSGMLLTTYSDSSLGELENPIAVDPRDGSIYVLGTGSGGTVNYTTYKLSNSDDAGLGRATSTTLSCPATALDTTQPTTCTITVTDTAAGTPSAPQGTAFLASTNYSWDQGAGAHCQLSPVSAGASSSCQVTYVPGGVSAYGSGPQTDYLRAGYTPSERTHTPSASGAQDVAITVTARATSTALSCDPGTLAVGQSANCTVTVTDTDPDSAHAAAPTGGITLQVPGSSQYYWYCLNLTPVAGSSTTSTCTFNNVTFDASLPSGTSQKEGVVALYTADPVHAASQDTFDVRVNPIPDTVSISCAPSSIEAGESTSCKATVTDTHASGASPPQGTVAFTSSSSNGTFDSGSCTLGPANGSSTTSTCYGQGFVSYSRTGDVPIGGQSDKITGAYTSSDGIHADGSGSTDVQVSRRPVSATLLCSGSGVSPGDPAITCTVYVSDAGTTGSPSPPQGTVTFSSSHGSFPDGTMCTLADHDGQQTCGVRYRVPSGVAADGDTIVGTYAPSDGVHRAASPAPSEQISILQSPGGPGSPGTPPTITAVCYGPGAPVTPGTQVTVEPLMAQVSGGSGAKAYGGNVWFRITSPAAPSIETYASAIQRVGAGSPPIWFSQDIPQVTGISTEQHGAGGYFGLNWATTYHYRAFLQVAYNTLPIQGPDCTFRTPPEPPVITSPAMSFSAPGFTVPTNATSASEPQNAVQPAAGGGGVNATATMPASGGTASGAVEGAPDWWYVACKVLQFACFDPSCPPMNARDPRFGGCVEAVARDTGSRRSPILLALARPRNVKGGRFTLAVRLTPKFRRLLRRHHVKYLSGLQLVVLVAPNGGRPIAYHVTIRKLKV